MAKNKTEIHVTTVFDGELDATDVFVSLISQKYGKTNTKEYLLIIIICLRLLFYKPQSSVHNKMLSHGCQMQSLISFFTSSCLSK